MKTFELTVRVSDDHTVTLKLPDDVTPGEHRVRLVIEDGAGSSSLFNPEGLWAGYGADISSEDIAEARREMWGKFDDKDPQ